ncbi:acetaldehyde dehydrogenase ethanolamine utilization cluster [Photobacterium aphoticum]|uniref:Acetaldehyde dehydrogenase ethanolamine utilization cluster n=1 Tax=Photobacterium aphoticum TaxID=754436 RepID=A0A090QQZ9_9GAMM|nr:acetaldehyde dehydrogenase ethanolamine utilization cluster [Photobacterium aphoticum]
MMLDKDLQSIQAARELVKNAKNAQRQFAKFTQEQVDSVVAHIAAEAARHAEPLAKAAHEETGFGRWQDKVLKNQFASTQVHAHIRDMKTVGVITDDTMNKIMEVGVPLGVITALVPSTNPTSTIFYKTLIALKAGNAIIFSPHPNAKVCSQQAIDVVKRAAREAGAPEGIVDGVTMLTMQATETLMKSKDVSLILATGGEGMVRAAYASGTPTISGGPGNGPAFIERSANIPQAVKDIITSKTFDNGVICASEQSIIVERCIYDQVHFELVRQALT